MLDFQTSPTVSLDADAYLKYLGPGERETTILTV